MAQWLSIPGLVLAPRSFSPGTPVFPSPQKNQHDLEFEGHRFVSRTVNCLFIFYYYYL